MANNEKRTGSPPGNPQKSGGPNKPLETTRGLRSQPSDLWRSLKVGDLCRYMFRGKIVGTVRIIALSSREPEDLRRTTPILVEAVGKPVRLWKRGGCWILLLAGQPQGVPLSRLMPAQLEIAPAPQSDGCSQPLGGSGEEAQSAGGATPRSGEAQSAAGAEPLRADVHCGCTGRKARPWCQWGRVHHIRHGTDYGALELCERHQRALERGLALAKATRKGVSPQVALAS